MTTYEAGDVTLEKVREFVWEIPQTGGMNAPARILASESLLDEISEDKTLEQLRNSTHLPGVRKYALCMPDGHQGTGFPSAASRASTPKTAVSRPEQSATTSIAGCE